MSDEFAAPAKAATGQRAEDRVKRDQWGRYLLPDPTTGEEVAWTRATTLKKTLAKGEGLSIWKQRQTALGMGRRPDLVALASTITDPSLQTSKDTLSDVVKQAQAAAGSDVGRNLGTALHAATERLDRGEFIQHIHLPAPFDADLAAYDRFRRANGIVVQPEHIERIVIVPELQVAGTLDRLAFWRGSRKVLDLKTGQNVTEYGQLESAIQFACYAHAALMWNLDTQQYEPMPEVDQELAMQLHLPSAGAAAGLVPSLQWVNIAAGWVAAQVAYQVRAMQKGEASLMITIPDLPTAPAAQGLIDAAIEQDQQRAAVVTSVEHAGVTYVPSADPSAPQVVIGVPEYGPPPGHEPSCALYNRTALTAGSSCDCSVSIAIGQRAAAELDPVRAAILAIRSHEAMSLLYQQGTAAGAWTPAMTELGTAVLAAYVTPCTTTGVPHGDTVACGCGYRRPEALDG